jgi:hypothetical protein
MSPQQRSRLLLVLLVLAFGTPFVTAVVMRFGGWQPGQTRNYGSLVQPPQDWSAIPLKTQDGKDYPWDPLGRRWHLLVLPSSPCGDLCLDQAKLLQRLWLSEGRRADKLDVLWPGHWPDGLERFGGLREVRLPDRLREQIPVAATAEQGMALALIDHNGFLVMTYGAGFEPSRMRRDLDRLVK